MSKSAFSYHQALPIHESVVNNNYEDFLEAIETIVTKVIDLVDDNKDTALNLAIKHEREEMVNVLIGRLADPTIRNKQILDASLMALIVNDSASIRKSVDEYCENYKKNYHQIVQTKKTAIEFEQEEWQKIELPEAATNDNLPSTTMANLQDVKPNTLVERINGMEYI